KLKNSLYAISKTAQYFGLDLSPVKINKEQFNNILPFIAHLNSNIDSSETGHFILVTKIDEQKVYFYDKGDSVSSKEEFLEKFSGYCLITGDPAKIGLIPMLPAHTLYLYGARSYKGTLPDLDPLFKEPSTTDLAISAAITIGSSLILGGGLKDFGISCFTSQLGQSATNLAVHEFGWSPGTSQIFGYAVGGAISGTITTYQNPRQYLSETGSNGFWKSWDKSPLLRGSLMGGLKGAAIGGSNLLAYEAIKGTSFYKKNPYIARQFGSLAGSAFGHLGFGLALDALDLKTTIDITDKQLSKDEKFHGIDVSPYKYGANYRIPSSIFGDSSFSNTKLAWSDPSFRSSMISQGVGLAVEYAAIKGNWFGKHTMSYSQVLGSSLGGYAGARFTGQKQSFRQAIGTALLRGGVSVGLNALGGDYDSATDKNKLGLTRLQMAGTNYLATAGVYSLASTLSSRFKTDWIEPKDFATNYLTFGGTSPLYTKGAGGWSQTQYIEKLAQFSGIANFKANADYAMQRGNYDSWNQFVDDGRVSNILPSFSSSLVNYTASTLHQAAVDNVIGTASFLPQSFFTDYFVGFHTHADSEYGDFHKIAPFYRTYEGKGDKLGKLKEGGFVFPDLEKSLNTNQVISIMHKDLYKAVVKDEKDLSSLSSFESSDLGVEVRALYKDSRKEKGTMFVQPVLNSKGAITAGRFSYENDITDETREGQFRSNPLINFSRVDNDIIFTTITGKGGVITFQLDNRNGITSNESEGVITQVGQAKGQNNLIATIMAQVDQGNIDTSEISKTLKGEKDIVLLQQELRDVKMDALPGDATSLAFDGATLSVSPQIVQSKKRGTDLSKEQRKDILSQVGALKTTEGKQLYETASSLINIVESLPDRESSQGNNIDKLGEGVELSFITPIYPDSKVNISGGRQKLLLNFGDKTVSFAPLYSEGAVWNKVPEFEVKTSSSGEYAVKDAGINFTKDTRIGHLPDQQGNVVIGSKQGLYGYAAIIRSLVSENSSLTITVPHPSGVITNAVPTRLDLVDTFKTEATTNEIVANIDNTESLNKITERKFTTSYSSAEGQYTHQIPNANAVKGEVVDVGSGPNGLITLVTKGDTAVPEKTVEMWMQIPSLRERGHELIASKFSLGIGTFKDQPKSDTLPSSEVKPELTLNKVVEGRLISPFSDARHRINLAEGTNGFVIKPKNGSYFDEKGNFQTEGLDINTLALDYGEWKNLGRAKYEGIKIAVDSKKIDDKPLLAYGTTVMSEGSTIRESVGLQPDGKNPFNLKEFKVASPEEISSRPYGNVEGKFRVDSWAVYTTRNAGESEWQVPVFTDVKFGENIQKEHRIKHTIKDGDRTLAQGESPLVAQKADFNGPISYFEELPFTLIKDESSISKADFSLKDEGLVETALRKLRFEETPSIKSPSIIPEADQDHSIKVADVQGAFILPDKGSSTPLRLGIGENEQVSMFVELRDLSLSRPEEFSKDIPVAKDKHGGLFSWAKEKRFYKVTNKEQFQLDQTGNFMNESNVLDYTGTGVIFAHHLIGQISEEKRRLKMNLTKTGSSEVSVHDFPRPYLEEIPETAIDAANLNDSRKVDIQGEHTALFCLRQDLVNQDIVTPYYGGWRDNQGAVQLSRTISTPEGEELYKNREQGNLQIEAGGLRIQLSSGAEDAYISDIPQRESESQNIAGASSRENSQPRFDISRILDVSVKGEMEHLKHNGQTVGDNIFVLKSKEGNLEYQLDLFGKDTFSPLAFAHGSEWTARFNSEQPLIFGRRAFYAEDVNKDKKGNIVGGTVTIKDGDIAGAKVTSEQRSLFDLRWAGKGRNLNYFEIPDISIHFRENQENDILPITQHTFIKAVDRKGNVVEGESWKLTEVVKLRENTLDKLLDSYKAELIKERKPFNFEYFSSLDKETNKFLYRQNSDSTHPFYNASFSVFNKYYMTKNIAGEITINNIPEGKGEITIATGDNYEQKIDYFHRNTEGLHTAFLEKHLNIEGKDYTDNLFLGGGYWQKTRDGSLRAWGYDPIGNKFVAKDLDDAAFRELAYKQLSNDYKLASPQAKRQIRQLYETCFADRHILGIVGRERGRRPLSTNPKIKFASHEVKEINSILTEKYYLRDISRSGSLNTITYEQNWRNAQKDIIEKFGTKYIDDGLIYGVADNALTIKKGGAYTGAALLTAADIAFFSKGLASSKLWAGILLTASVASSWGAHELYHYGLTDEWLTGREKFNTIVLSAVPIGVAKGGKWLNTTTKGARLIQNGNKYKVLSPAALQKLGPGHGITKLLAQTPEPVVSTLKFASETFENGGRIAKISYHLKDAAQQKSQYAQGFDPEPLGLGEGLLAHGEGYLWHGAFHGAGKIFDTIKNGTKYGQFAKSHPVLNDIIVKGSSGSAYNVATGMIRGDIDNWEDAGEYALTGFFGGALFKGVKNPIVFAAASNFGGSIIREGLDIKDLALEGRINKENVLEIAKNAGIDIGIDTAVGAGEGFIWK
ncbi:MAG: hypothetical protein ISS44_04720, partial [Candidatus Omnitrophica bacterium]|nr:hypothetical protein [Candidatus Omnitrophota bacterium]